MDRTHFFSLVVLLVLALTLAPQTSLSAPPNIQTLNIGDSAPDFNLPGMVLTEPPTGKKPGIQVRNYRLHDFSRARILVLIFTCNHCPTAQAYEDRIIQLTQDYKAKGVAVVAISPNDPNSVRLDELGYSDLGDSFADMKIRVIDKRYNFPYLFDGENQKVSQAYGPTTTPHVFIFDKERKLRFVGRIDNSEKLPQVTTHDTRNAIDALLAGKPVPVEKTRTFGCSIKWAAKRGSVKQAQQRWAQEKVTLQSIDVNQAKQVVANTSDKLLLINFWATWCGPCIVEFPDLVDMNRMYRRRNFQFITVSLDSPDQKDKVLAFLKNQQASGTNYLFASENKYPLIEAVDKNWSGALPYSLLIAPGGKTIYRHAGPIDPLHLKKTIVTHLGRYYK
jgi:thiol-disulfide isomerase/thioredoxin